MSKVEIAVGTFFDNEEETNRKTRQLIDLARIAIIAEIVRDPTHWKYGFIQDITSKVVDHISSLQTNLSKLSADMEHSAMASGIGIGGSTAPVYTPTTMSTVDPILMRALSEYRIDMIRGVTDAMRAKVTSIIRRAIITGRSPEDTIREIGLTIDSGAFKNLTFRATRIVRTEFARIAAIAGQIRLEEIGKVVSNLRKMWVAAMVNTRPAHVIAHGQVVPYDQPYIVGGESLMYPLDPNGSAGNVINCRCVSIPMMV